MGFLVPSAAPCSHLEPQIQSSPPQPSPIKKPALSGLGSWVERNHQDPGKGIFSQLQMNLRSTKGPTNPLPSLDPRNWQSPEPGLAQAEEKALLFSATPSRKF